MADHTTEPAGPPRPSPEVVRQHVRQILDSHPFATSTRSRRFLTYIVEQTLAGQTEGIKELVLGVEVFDRPTDFDPRIDPIVRVEAGKMRKRLQDYYANEGAAAPLRIEVPKGGYVPRFQFPKEPPAPELPRPAMARGKRHAAGALAMLLIAAGAWWGARQARAKPQPSIAVLPFLNLSTDPANEYLADGLAEELTDALCRAGGMRVAARTSSFFFKGKPADVRDIGARLHVAFIVEGSVRKQDERLRVTAQLIRTDDGYHVWSGSVERQLQDVFAVEQEIAASVVSALQVKLTGAQDRRLKKSHTASQQAFDLYLRGRHALTTGAPLDIGPAVPAIHRRRSGVRPTLRSHGRPVYAQHLGEPATPRTGLQSPPGGPPGARDAAGRRRSPRAAAAAQIPANLWWGVLQRDLQK